MKSAPIVNNGVMFVSTPYSQVIALDAATGDLLWRGRARLGRSRGGFKMKRERPPARLD